LLSSLRVNFHKSQIKVIEVDNDASRHFSWILKCSHMKIPFNIRNAYKNEFMERTILETCGRKS